MNEQEVENKLQENGANAPRLNPEHIDSVIVGTDFHVFPNTTVTVCLIELKNGAHVIGKNYGSAHRDNNDWDLGRKLAYDDARSQIWQLEGYLLKQNLYQIGQCPSTQAVS